VESVLVRLMVQIIDAVVNILPGDVVFLAQRLYLSAYRVSILSVPQIKTSRYVYDWDPGGPITCLCTGALSKLATPLVRPMTIS